MLKTAQNGDEAKRLLNSNYVQNQLRPLFSTDAGYQSFINSVGAERAMFNTKFATLGGSQTAGRLAEDTGGEGGGILGNLALGGAAMIAHEPAASAPFLARAGKAAYQKLAAPAPAVNTAIANRLFSGDQATNQLFLQQLANGALRPYGAAARPALTVPAGAIGGALVPGYFQGPVQ